jgi:hypothetical protein
LAGKCSNLRRKSNFLRDRMDDEIGPLCFLAGAADVHHVQHAKPALAVMDQHTILHAAVAADRHDGFLGQLL